MEGEGEALNPEEQMVQDIALLDEMLAESAEQALHLQHEARQLDLLELHLELAEKVEKLEDLVQTLLAVISGRLPLSAVAAAEPPV